MDPLLIQGDEDLGWMLIETLDDTKRILNKLIDKRIIISSRKYNINESLVSCDLDDSCYISLKLIKIHLQSFDVIKHGKTNYFNLK